MGRLKITILENYCTRCGHCGAYFPGLPELAFRYKLVPIEVQEDQLVMDYVRGMIYHCEGQAIGLDHCGE